MTEADVAIVGTGPNGLAAAVVMARAGLRVQLFEGHHEIGGGLRTTSLFDADITHDVCAAVHPMAAASRFFREFDLASRGVRLRLPEISYAHPLPDGTAALAHHDLEATCARLGADGGPWRRMMTPLLERSSDVIDLALSHQRAVPRDLRVAIGFAARTLTLGTRLGKRTLTTEAGKALLTGVAAHAVGRLPSLASGAIALLLGHLAHGSGWPLPEGGSSRIAETLAADITAHGGTFHTECKIDDLRQLRGSKVVLFDTAPKGLLQAAGDLLPARYARQLSRFRHGPGAAKVDFLVNAPIPWKDPDVGLAGTVHLGGTQAQIRHQEGLTAAGAAAPEPFVLVVDPAVTDPTRARGGKRPVWAYAHVPNGSSQDPVPMVQARIEQYAPGFTETVVASRGISARDYEAYNPNYVGGDINGGAVTLKQSVLRPAPRVNPYRTPLRGVYLCSASTPPGPGVHGMSGYLAARSALRHEFGIRTTPILAP
ncbi:phytoene desaturase family protein [Streptomyces sp. NPDC059631]|uniref:phytoene desaturase family protein n=1 Tax=Streptomyces sp. NPDC059631 TaxID=3346890 RepID=UPI0036C8EB0D